MYIIFLWYFLLIMKKYFVFSAQFWCGIYFWARVILGKTKVLPAPRLYIKLYTSMVVVCLRLSHVGCTDLFKRGGVDPPKLNKYFHKNDIHTHTQLIFVKYSYSIFSRVLTELYQLCEWFIYSVSLSFYDFLFVKIIEKMRFTKR